MEAAACIAVMAAIAAALLAKCPEFAFSIPHLNSFRPTTPINRPIAVTYAWFTPSMENKECTYRMKDNRIRLVRESFGLNFTIDFNYTEKY